MKTYRFESHAINSDEKIDQACSVFNMLAKENKNDLKKFIEKNAVRLEDIDEKMYFEV